MATSALSALEGIYQDKVFQATELNRKHSHVIDCARTGPVTITRNNELFALLRREQVAELVHAVNLLKEVTQVLAAAMVVAKGGDSVLAHYDWVQAFDEADLTAMRDDLMAAIDAASCGDGNWGDVDCILHQWRESGLAARSGVLSATLADASEDVDVDLTIRVEGAHNDGEHRR